MLSKTLPWWHILVGLVFIGLIAGCGSEQQPGSPRPTAEDPIGTALAQIPTLPPSDETDPTPTSELLFQAGQQAWTPSTTDTVLWTQPSGGEPVYERPKLYGGALVRIVERRPDATQVRTEEGVVGWIQGSADKTLTSEPQVSARAQPLKPGARVQIVAEKGIPLRVAADPNATKIREVMPRGSKGVVQYQRGDWLEVVFENELSGWIRWYYNGIQHVEAMP